MSTPTADVIALMRPVLGDDPAVIGHQEFTDAQLAASVFAVVRLGQVPGFTISNDRVTITPTIEEAKDWALIVAKAAMQRVSGSMDGAMSWRTRPISVTDRGERKRDLLMELRDMLYDSQGGLPFYGGRSNFVSWLASVRTNPLMENATVDAEEGIQMPSL
jgi:hypothetical protein